MKPKSNKEQIYASILQSAIASAKIEGIIVSTEVANHSFKKVMASLKKADS